MVIHEPAFASTIFRTQHIQIKPYTESTRTGSKPLPNGTWRRLVELLYPIKPAKSNFARLGQSF